MGGVLYADRLKIQTSGKKKFSIYEHSTNKKDELD